MNVFEQNKKYFPTSLQEVVFYDKYSRYNWDLGRRETWEETVNRTVDFLHELAGDKLDNFVYDRIRKAILNMEVMPSMRLLAMAGPAARRNNLCLYNCSFHGIDNIKSFGETLLISFCGCGVGFSVEKKYIDKLPNLPRHLNYDKNIFTVEDTTEGWQKAIDILIEYLYNGLIPTFDYSQLRKAGTPLKVKGGTASGPKPLEDTIEFIKNVFKDRYYDVIEYAGNPSGYKLRPIDVHDIMCSIGQCSISGGTRRCLPKGTKVHSSKGLIPIESVMVGDMVMTDIGYKKVIDSIYQGKQNIASVTTENGMTIRCTPDHRIAVLSNSFGGYEFKQAQNLIPNDRLLFITNPIDNKEYDSSLKSLPDFMPGDTIRTDVKQPRLDEETAWILGKFLADGYVHIIDYTENGKEGNCKVAFSCNTNEKDQISKILLWFKDHGISAITTKESGNWTNVVTNTRRISKWFSNYKVANESLNIPEEIWKSSFSIKLSFIRGVFDGDGYLTGRPFNVATTIYQDFGKQIVELLASIGILAELKLIRKRIGVWKPLWSVTIKDSMSLDTLRTYFTDIPKRKGRQSGYNIPKEFVIRDIGYKRARGKLFLQKDVNHHSVSNITGITNFIPVKVKDVTISNNQEDTYDISVEDQHTFVIGGGFLVHNTAMISLFDKDDKELLNAKSGKYNNYRWNANNSMVFNYEFTQSDLIQWAGYLEKNQNGEPGLFSLYNSKYTSPIRRSIQNLSGINPCQPGFATVLTPDGIRTFDDIDIGSIIWSGKRWTKVINKVYSGEQEVYRYFTNFGSFVGTENHKILQQGYKIEVKYASEIDICPLPNNTFDFSDIFNPVLNKDYLGNFEVYDITVDAEEHTYWSGGLLVSNCGEIVLRNKQLCNLSAAIARVDDTIDTLKEKVEIASIIGTIQATATDFPGLRKEWSENCKEEALLGVDITGQMDCSMLQGRFAFEVFEFLKEKAISTNKEYAKKLGINESVAVTCSKPSGNTSQLVNCSSGIHPRYSKYYIRNIRINVNTPIFKVLYESGMNYVPENGQDYKNMTTAVFSFPVKSPDNAIVREDISAIDMCNHWKTNKIHYTEHNPSVTINYKEAEVLDLVNWLWENKDIIGGMSFLPYSNAQYDNMPYIEITEEEYEKLNSKMPEIKWELLEKYENTDTSTASQEVSCFAGQCMI